jgi:phosphoribosylanthranilate isomerase
MIQIKICGITNLDDALGAVDAGADALGFVFYPKSPRAVSRNTAATIVARLPESITPVGVFVDEDQQFVRETLQQCSLRIAQLHGAESADYCATLGFPVIKGLRIRTLPDAETLAGYHILAFLLDAFVAGVPGGTGSRLDWDLVSTIHAPHPVILAGGLTPENVGEAIHRVRPHAVDVSSGVERGPRRKDPAKMKAFVMSARAGFASLSSAAGKGTGHTIDG